MENEERLCKPREAAAYLHICQSVLNDLQDSGVLLPYSVLKSGHRRYLWDDVVALRKTWEKKPIPEDAVLMDTNDVAKYLGVHVVSVRRYADAGDLQECLVIPPRNRRYYLAEDVEAFYKSTLR